MSAFESEAARVAAEAVRKGWIVMPKPPPAVVAVPPRDKGFVRVPHTSGRLVRAGRALAEPFTRAALTSEAGIDSAMASNVLTAWRKAGWVVKDRGGWVRTSAFGEGA